MRRQEPIVKAFIPPVWYKEYEESNIANNSYIRARFMEDKFVSSSKDFTQKYNINPSTTTLKDLLQMRANEEYQKDLELLLDYCEIPYEYVGSVEEYLCFNIVYENHTEGLPRIIVHEFPGKFHNNEYFLRIYDDTTEEDLIQMLAYFKSEILKDYGIEPKRKRVIPNLKVDEKISKLKLKGLSSKEIKEELKDEVFIDVPGIDKRYSRARRRRT